MITESEFITVSYTPDMTQVGIKFACKSLLYTYNRMESNHFNQLRRVVVGKAIALAFKRYLNNNEIPHNMFGFTPFAEPDNYDIVIGGRRCDIKSFMLVAKNYIRLVRKEPHRLLNAQALVPVDQMADDKLNDDDIYIFAFLTALITPNRRTLNNAISAGQPISMLHALPHQWVRPNRRGSLGELIVKSNMANVIKLEMGGRDDRHQLQTETLILNPQIRTAAQQDFSALSYFCTMNLPDETIGIHSSTLNQTYLIKPMAWGNIWVYGMEIIFVGYITPREFQKNAVRLPRGSGFQYSNNRIENFGLPIQDLKPLNELLDRAKEWSRDQKQ